MFLVTNFVFKRQNIEGNGILWVARKHVCGRGQSVSGRVLVGVGGRWVPECLGIGAKFLGAILA